MSPDQQLQLWLDSGSINLFGRPFAGKDTCARQLANHVGGVVIGSGEILRSSHRSPTISAQIDRGKLAPTQEYIQIMVPYLSQPSLAGKPLILSSVGRWHGEENAIITGLTNSKHPLKAVIYLEISEAEMQRRLEAAHELQDRGMRIDDASDILQQRIQEFNQKTLPVIDFYQQAGLLIRVNGEQSRPAVMQELLTKLKEFSDVTS